MAGGKKKKKPASNPARGFATTSIASKPRADISDPVTSAETPPKPDNPSASHTAAGTILAASSDANNPTQVPAQISPEDFEKQLDESELQGLVDKHSQKSKRDATRQIARLQTDRRLLRSQADSLNTRKWLPPDLMEEILDVIVVDGRSAIHSVGQDSLSSQKLLSEEDLTIKLWILQQTLDGAGFHTDKVKLAVDYILATSDHVIVNKDSVWGLEESLEWLARECSRDQLPDYESSHKKLQSLKFQTGMFRCQSRHFVFLAYMISSRFSYRKPFSFWDEYATKTYWKP
jgi:ATP-dependent RNA helicase DHX29